MTNHTIGAFIASKTVGDLVKELKPRSDLVDVPSSETLETVFDILLANDILSVPVYKEDSKPKEYLGFVSVLDLVRLVADSVRLSDIVGNLRDASRLMLISNKFLFLVDNNSIPWKHCSQIVIFCSSLYRWR
jgi:CBS domain containing-hemolysin-like protein